MYLSVKQVSERIGVSTRTIFRRIEAGEIPIVRLGTRIIRINESDLDEYIEKNRR